MKSEIEIKEIKEIIENKFFKLDLKNNSNDEIIKQCDFLSYDSNIVLSLKHSFNFEYH